jgi:hypothetical protein
MRPLKRSNNYKVVSEDLPHSVQADGSTYGERGSIGSQYETFNVEIAANSTQVFGDLKNGVVNFMLSPSSDLLGTSTSGAFQISDANPRVFNVQVFGEMSRIPRLPITQSYSPPTYLWAPNNWCTLRSQVYLLSIHFLLSVEEMRQSGFSELLRTFNQLHRSDAQIVKT